MVEVIKNSPTEKAKAPGNTNAYHISDDIAEAIRYRW